MRLPAAAIMLLGCISAWAQTPVAQSDLSVPSKIAPAYFGPNAFPVPEIPEARIPGGITAELAGEFALGQGQAQDLTYGPSFKLTLPLWTDRAALTVWMPIVEWWRYDAQTAAMRRLQPQYLGGGSGHDSGDVYVSTDLHLLKADGRLPDIMVRAVLKTASGNHYGEARYYDAPGYFFDATVAKSLYFNGFIKEFRAAASSGFLCWQTDNGRQNDAVQAGISAMADGGRFRFEAQAAGYLGWENDGDRPITVRARLDYHTGTLSPFFSVAYGLHDYPFVHFRLGVKYPLK